MGLIKCIKKYLDRQKIEYYCSKCDKLIATIFQTNNHTIELQLTNSNCSKCGEQISQSVVVITPIIDGTIYK